MKIRIRSIFSIPAVLLLAISGGCFWEAQSVPLAQLPLLANCEAVLDPYSDKLRQGGYRLSFSRRVFSNFSGPPTGVLGILEISGDLSPDELQVVINGLELLCMPTTSMEVISDELGYRELLRTIGENANKGISESYLSHRDGKFILYYAGSSEAEKRQLLE